MIVEEGRERKEGEGEEEEEKEEEEEPSTSSPWVTLSFLSPLLRLALPRSSAIPSFLADLHEPL